MKPQVLILHANGTNRDLDVAQAFELAGATPEIVHINQLRDQKKRWQDYQILVIPGGFSYADVLGAGRLFALDLKTYFVDEVQHFIETGKPVLGICNGFQTLVKTGLLPGWKENTLRLNEDRASQGRIDARLQGRISPKSDSMHFQTATLTFNDSGKFECRWVTLTAQSNNCLWTKNLAGPIYCPIAHGEGRFVLHDNNLLTQLKNNQQIALCYVDGNPNGSVADIAGICNPQGNVLGLMPHPENHVFDYQHPHWTRGEKNGSGLPLFMNAVKAVE
jgi:phosphoribosylformylglycinamidine synthase subunit PurQ / glutaminase